MPVSVPVTQSPVLRCDADWHLRQADRLRRETEATSDVQRGADHPHGVVAREALGQSP